MNGYFAYPHHTRSPAALWTLSRDIRAWRSDIAIYANETRSIMETLRDGAFLRLCGARRVLGLPLTRRHREHVFAPVTGLYEREAARIARTLEKIGAIDIDKPKNRRLCLSIAEQAAAEQIVSGCTIEEDLFEPESRRSADVPHCRPIMRRQPVWVGIFTENFLRHPKFPHAETVRRKAGHQKIRWFVVILHPARFSVPSPAFPSRERYLACAGSDRPSATAC